MKKRSLILPIFALGLALPLFACGGNGESKAPTCEVLKNPDDPLSKTPITDSLAFAYEADYATKDFNEPLSGVAYGKVTLVSCTDGDTVNFRTINNTLIKLRFLGVNTPESTAKVEPWGVKASKFTSHQLGEATEICLVNDIDTYNKYDSSGGRNLGFIWYKTATHGWRNLNLELVEQAYSRNFLFTDSPVLHYMDAFTRAGEFAKECGYRVNGAIDPDYDYSNTVVTATLYNVRTNYEELGIDADLGTSGKQLRVTAIVVGQIGDNMILRDCYRDQEQAADAPYTCMYAYAGFNTSLASKVAVGDVVRFYCRATSYPKGTTNYQLSDLKTSSYGSQKFEVLSSIGDSDYNTYFAEDNGYAPDEVAASTIKGKEDLGKLSGLFVRTQITVRMTEVGDYDDDGKPIEGKTEKKWYNESTTSTGSCTIYAYVKDSKTVCNLRIDGTSYPLLRYTDFEPKKGEDGKYIEDEKGNYVMRSFNVTGYLVPYFENYQIQLLNNIRGAGYVTPIED